MITARGLSIASSAEQAPRAGERAERVVLGGVGERRAPDGRQSDAESAQSLLDVIEDLPAIGPDRSERDAERYRDLRTVFHPVRPGHREVEPVAGRELEHMRLVLVGGLEDQVAVAARVELLQLVLG